MFWKALLTLTEMLAWEETKSFLHTKVHLLPFFKQQSDKSKGDLKPDFNSKSPGNEPNGCA